MTNQQERLMNMTKSMNNINNHKITKVVIHLENGEQEVIRKGIDKNFDTWLAIIKPFLIAAFCRVVKALSLGTKEAA